MPTSADPQQVPARPEPAQTPASAQDQEAAAAVPASAWGLLDDGSFKARLGTGLTIAADLLESGQIDLSTLPNPVPGLALKTATFRRNRLDISADVAVPGLDEAELTVRINSDGDARIRGRASRQLNIAALGNPSVSLTISEEGAIGGSVTVEGADMAPSIAGLTAEGGGTLTIDDGKISGNGTVTLSYRDLGNGTVNFDFGENGAFSANGTLTITPPFADEITAEISGDNAGNLSAEATITAGELSTPIAGLELNGGTITIGYDNGDPSLSVADFTATYRNLGTVTIASASLGRDRRISGNGSFEVNLPAMDPVVGTLRLANGAVSGSVTVSASDFPDGLPITSGSITATLSENGALGFSGTVGVDLGPAGTGSLSASYSETGDLAIGAEVDLTVPGLQGAHVSLAYVNGDIQGEAQVPIDTVALPGLGGEVTVRFAEGRWSGETEMSYSADNGKLSGTIRVTLAQTEEGDLQVGGGGSVTAQLMPRLAGTLEATILPEGGIDISGAIEVTEPLELFPEKRLDKELFKYSQNIPLWAMLVAVIRVRAGIRAGIGPGVFRNIRVEGSYTIGADEADPTFSITGEMYIPAFAEAYVAFGAGLGLDVLLGSLTGGIEGVATAGIYGAISVVPELNYADGDWSIEGVATIAAGARLTLGLNAWAEIEALFVTVWEREWKLAEHVMSVGPDLALQAKMNYVFGSGEAPELEMTTSDIDTDKLIQDAMPKDGPGPSGAREALKNKAEWKGALKEKREAEMPAEAENAGKPGKPPEPAARPPKRSKVPDPNADPKDKPVPKTTPSQKTSGSQTALQDAAKPDPSVRGAAPESEVPNAGQPRYPKPLTMKTLEEAPATLPRTKKQEKEDVDAAASMIQIISRSASDSDALDDYFPAIKRRFRLSHLAFVGDFKKGFRVKGGINPNLDESVYEPIRGENDPAASGSRDSKVDWKREKRFGSVVGLEMIADPIGPDHPAGSSPKPGIQPTLMNKLPTIGSVAAAPPGQTIPGNQLYIRGHLLNDNVGGPGLTYNLFPITVNANSEHKNQIEKHVKRWVNDDRYWVRYTVTVDEKDTNLASYGAAGFVGPGYVNANFIAEASVIDTNLNSVPELTRNVVIRSRFPLPSTPQPGDPNFTVEDTEETGFGDDNVTMSKDDEKAFKDANETSRTTDQGDPAPFLTASDDNIILRMPSKSTKTGRLDHDVYKQLQQRIWRTGKPDVKRRMTKHSGVGDAKVELLFDAYEQAKGKTFPEDGFEVSGLSVSQKGDLRAVQGVWPSILANWRTYGRP
ncbi:hypothetical protein [Cognatishimia sp. MH4019]|uniref:hypothetical protein n=1 Tax=Cognatishimia sp. MH4019 TaxID=2854030 RepID=UPI001CD6B908|nr:hypothetical protein [Cognatishimia sp. MH4019]